MITRIIQIGEGWQKKWVRGENVAMKAGSENYNMAGFQDGQRES